MLQAGREVISSPCLLGWALAGVAGGYLGLRHVSPHRDQARFSYQPLADERCRASRLAWGRSAGRGLWPWVPPAPAVALGVGRRVGVTHGTRSWGQQGVPVGLTVLPAPCQAGSAASPSLALTAVSAASSPGRPSAGVGICVSHITGPDRRGAPGGRGGLCFEASCWLWPSVLPPGPSVGQGPTARLGSPRARPALTRSAPFSLSCSCQWHFCDLQLVIWVQLHSHKSEHWQPCLLHGARAPGLPPAPHFGAERRARDAAVGLSPAPAPRGSSPAETAWGGC